MLYNIWYRTKLKGVRASIKGFILCLPKEKLSEFVENYSNGITKLFLRGKSYFFNNIIEIKIFDNSKNELLSDYDVEWFEKQIHKTESLGVEVDLSEYGTILTDEYIKGPWGYKKEKNTDIIRSNNKEIYVNPSRIEELKNIKNSKFDFLKLIRLCEELNNSFQYENYFATGMLFRAIIDHIPHVFGFKKFDEVANNYKSEGKSKSFKESMEQLNKSMRKITDSLIHSQITKSEVLPNETQVDCKRELDVLLGEVVRVLNN